MMQRIPIGMTTRVADPGYLSRIRVFTSRIPDLHQRIDSVPIPDPGVKKAPDPGSAKLMTTMSATVHINPDPDEETMIPSCKKYVSLKQENFHVMP
jgi:hypothetical protein